MTGNAETKQILNGQARAEYGVITTWKSLASGRTLTIARMGAPTAALRESCDKATALDPTFRLISYSTPQTIYSDMQGDREGGAQKYRTAPTLPETIVLGRIGRQNLLHPDLQSTSDRRPKPREAA